MVRRPIAAHDVALKASGLAYITDQDDLMKAVEDCNAELLRAFDVDHTQALLLFFKEPRYYVLAFRGTEVNFRDILTDIRAVPKALDHGWFHSGFLSAYHKVHKEIKKALKEHKVKKHNLIATGHSLGGALATVFSYYKECEFLITFGAPRTGNSRIMANLKCKARFRFVNKCDIVTQLPRGWMLGYRHPSIAWYINRHDDLLLNPGYTYLLFDRLLSCWFVPRIWAKRKFIDHRITEYGKALEVALFGKVFNKETKDG